MAGEAPGAVAPSEQWGNWRPQTAKEIAEEMARLRELAQRVRFQPATVKQFASQWLRPSRSEHAALTQWQTGAMKNDPRGLLATDLQDAVRLVARAAEQSKWQDDPEAFAKRLEYVAGSLGPRLREWMARSRVAAPGSIEAFRHYAECRYGDRLPEYATAELLADPINAALAAGDDIKQLTATQLMYREQEIGIYDYGGEYHKVDARRHCALRLLSRVVDDAAAAVVASGGDPASLYTAQQAAERGAAQFGKEWAPAVVTLRTAQAKLKAAAESPQGSAAEDGSESPAAADTVATASSKQRNRGGGRKPQRTRTALERKVFRLREQGWSFEEIDRVHLATEESAKNRSSFHVIERVQRRERRHKKADKTGQN